MQNKTVHILWDSSQLWGIMAYRAMRALGVSCRLVKSKEIAQGWLMCKRPAVLLAPGGGARRKAEALGRPGRKAIREWLAEGGFYLGICGGAGLALRHNSENEGLGICPWQRLAFPDRLYHLLSGHLRARGPDGQILLPVFWPARFEAESGGSIKILARYEAPGPDLWLADLPFMEAPHAVRQQWTNAGRLDKTLDFPAGQPLVIEGNFGRGAYILSYSHLETPVSKDANRWLANILQNRGIHTTARIVPTWRLAAPERANTPAAGAKSAILSAYADIWRVALMAEKAGFLFFRMPWLLGWRRGLPGMPCNHLLACLALLADLEANVEMEGYFEHCGREFQALLPLFLERAEAWFWNYRLAETVQPGQKEQMQLLNAERDGIFGHPMLGGGVIQKILRILEEMIYLAQPEDNA